MQLRPADFPRISALDRELAFLEEPDASIPFDEAGYLADSPLVGVKSNISVAGQAWTAGIGSRRDVIATIDATVVAKLRRAGASFLSRLNMDEAALGAACQNPAFRMTENPAAPGHSPGGSSGGSAAAVAAGVCDVALGTDTLGSVRIPATYCGVFGLKLGQSALPMSGVFPLAPSLDALGFLGASTRAIQEVLVACDVPRGPAISKVTTVEDLDLSGLTTEISDALRFAETALRDAGAQVEAGTLGLNFARTRADAFVRTEIEAANVLAGQVDLSEALRKLLAYGAGLTSEKRTAIDARLADAKVRLLAVVGRDRCLLVPTVAKPAFRLTKLAPPGQADFTALANVAGLPALSIPMPTNGLPVSVQLIGPMGSEWGLLALADTIAKAD